MAGISTPARDTTADNGRMTTRDELIAALTPVWDNWGNVRWFKEEATEAFADAVLGLGEIVPREALGVAVRVLIRAASTEAERDALNVLWRIVMPSQPPPEELPTCLRSPL